MMYSFNVTDQLIVFIYSVSFGILSCAAYSLLNFLFGLIFIHKSIHRYVTDSFFSVLLMISSFCFVLTENLGKVRIYMIIGVAFGVIIYRLTIGSTVNFLTEKLICIFRKIVKTIIRPFIWLYTKYREKISKKTHKKSSECIANKNKNVV